MLKIYTDFNSETADGKCWLLQYDNLPLEEQLEKLKVSVDDIVKLYQDGDFFVDARLDFQYVSILERVSWVAIPDWSTLQRVSSGDEG
jgi:hypothetical protein